MDHVIYMGLRNILMDSHASIKKDDDDCRTKSMAIVNKKLDALYQGIIRISPEPSSDAVEGEARRLCMTQINKSFKEAGRKLSSVTTDEMAEAVEANWESLHPPGPRICGQDEGRAHNQVEIPDQGVIAAQWARQCLADHGAIMHRPSLQEYMMDEST